MVEALRGRPARAPGATSPRPAPPSSERRSRRSSGALAAATPAAAPTATATTTAPATATTESAAASPTAAAAPRRAAEHARHVRVRRAREDPEAENGRDQDPAGIPVCQEGPRSVGPQALECVA